MAMSVSSKSHPKPTSAGVPVRRRRPRTVKLNPDPQRELTPRQRETLQLIAEGYSTKEIAHLLKVSVKTVETHRLQLKERLGIYTVAGLVRYAVRHGLTLTD